MRKKISNLKNSPDIGYYVTFVFAIIFIVSTITQHDIIQIISVFLLLISSAASLIIELLRIENYNRRLEELLKKIADAQKQRQNHKGLNYTDDTNGFSEDLDNLSSDFENIRQDFAIAIDKINQQ